MTHLTQALSDQALLQVLSLSKDATAIYTGEEIRIRMANDAMIGFWGKDQSVIGKTFEEAIPELKGQPFNDLLQEVWRSGVTYVAKDTAADLEVNGKLQTFYFDFEYRAIKNEKGETYCILHTATDVTESLLQRKIIKEKERIEQELNEVLAATVKKLKNSNEELASANEELGAINEEQMATNEELISTVDELKATQDSLQISQLKLREGEEALKFAINAANLGTWDIDPLTLKFKANDRLKSWFGLEPKEEIEVSKATDVVAEKDRSRVLAAIQKAMTFSSGGHYDIDYTIMNPVDKIARHVIAKGQTLFNSNKDPIRFSGTLQDITEEQKKIKELERVYEQANLSKEAAQLGTFDMDLIENTLEWDERCRTLFGISHKNKVSYEHDFIPGLHIDDKDRVVNIISNVFIKAISNGDYDVEYRTIGAEDGKLRWVRAKGKTLFNEKDEPTRFIGSVLEITEQKQDEQRKNDFIGMVSHELKTPLTSLKGYAQLLHIRAKKQEDAFSINALAKVEAQVNKMNTMINGFLNVSRLEAGKINIDKQDFNIDGLLWDVIEETRMITASSHSIDYLPDGQISVNADRDKIGSVISNLVSNAVKYSPKGTTVAINLKVTDRLVKVSIKDQGLGIKAEDTKKLFERYYRVENSYTKHIAGFGIGLYLSAEIINRHAGNIGVDSNVGEGSTFWFTLPLR
jgi:two-component system sensor histidine kinase VicK